MTRLCLLSMGRAEGCAETLLLPGWGGRSAWSVRAAPVPIPLAPTSIPNRAEGLTPALGQAGTPPPLCLSSPAARRPLCRHSPNRNRQHQGGGGRCMGCPAWPRLPGRAGPGRERYGEVWGHHAGTGAAGPASRWCFPRSWGRAGCTGSRTGGWQVGGLQAPQKLLFPYLCA